MTHLEQASLGQIAIVCKDVERATAFYRDTLRIPFLFAAGPTLSFFAAGGTRLMLSAGEGEETGTSVLYFKVDDIAATVSALASDGVRFMDAPHLVARMPDHELWLTAFRDSEDNILALMEERRP